mmetsp:Transcript_6949/g.20434  ORF Transcript_6949/g.20434 Transcript_6949/m.20434 type:complete len:225 (+) Transcript_6949:165-839(+)
MDGILADEHLERRLLLFLVSSDAIEATDVQTQRRQAATILQTCRRWRELLLPLSRSWKTRSYPPRPRKPDAVAKTAEQRRSLAERPLTLRCARYEAVTLADRRPYFDVSCYPITVRAEDDMELLSDLSTWGERYLDHWESGTYLCARCRRRLYKSSDKWSGPCAWPSWRRCLPGAVRKLPVVGYGSYRCAVHELYCDRCELFLGHQFEDAIEKGDTHPEARFRH